MVPTMMGHGWVTDGSRLCACCPPLRRGQGPLSKVALRPSSSPGLVLACGLLLLHPGARNFFFFSALAAPAAPLLLILFLLLLLLGVHSFSFFSSSYFFSYFFFLALARFTKARTSASARFAASTPLTRSRTNCRPPQPSESLVIRVTGHPSH